MTISHTQDSPTGAGPAGQAEPDATALRDIRCGRLDRAWVGRPVRLAGWVHRRRNLGGLLFIDLRDRSGLVQLSFGPDWSSEAAAELVTRLGPEDVVAVTGTVRSRPGKMANMDLATGQIEVQVEDLELLSKAEPLPILVAQPPEEELPSEELRLRHRVLDLRRAAMLRNFEIRHRAVAAARASLTEEGFLEVETPFLTRRTPEGARDYLVPSRVHPGKFYALPQSPQLYKQLLMAAGFDRYYQVARCLRDEDLRADRQPEFTQVDVEMSFVEEADVFGVCERMVSRMFRDTLDVKPSAPFPRLTYREAMEAYGTDKPDLRIEWRVQDFTSVLAGLGFGIFDVALKAGGRIRGLRVPDGTRLSRRQLDAANELARNCGAGGAVWLKHKSDGWSGAPARCLTDEAAACLADEHGVAEGDLLVLVADQDRNSNPAMDALRRRLAAEMNVVRDGFAWLWVTEFPLFEPDPDTGRPTSSHHPFTMPLDTDAERLKSHPFDVTSRAYDLVLNGAELVSGSIRCHDAELQRAILRTLGLSADEIEDRFGFLLEAFRYGVPPHGGFALGVDRVVATMVGADSIRDVIAFPKSTAARGLMEGSPSAISAAELEDLGIRLNPS